MPARLMHTAAAALGIWLMASPAVLSGGYGDPAQANDRIVGPMAATFAIIAIWEVTRPARWCNVALGAWMIAAPWILGYTQTAPKMQSVVVGLLLLLLSLARGKNQERYGGGWRAIWQEERLPDHPRHVAEP